MLRHRTLGISACLLAATWLLAMSASSVEAQIRIVEPGAANHAVVAQRAVAVEHLVQQGAKFESQNRWADALTHYEQALRQYPHDAQLKKRHDNAKIHYDLGRRYRDVSFRKSLITFRHQEALDQYGEVLTKIDTHYVDRGDWRSMVDRGARCLTVALNDETYRKYHLRGVAPERIDAFARLMNRTIGSTVIRSRNDARDLVGSVALLGERHLNLASPATIFEFTCGAVCGLDNYSGFLTSGQLKDVYSQIDGNFVGLGVELKAEDGALLIVKTIANSPAARAGIVAGDRIVAVDGKSTRELTTDGAATVLQGAEGTTADVTVRSVGREPRTLRVRREHVEVPSVDEVKIVDAENGVGYLRLVGFQRTTNRDVDRALWQLHRQGMKSLIIDLRGNPGGLLSASVEVADKFVDRGVIVSTKGRNAAEDFRYTAHPIATWRVPLVVLIDGDSASASEIFAGAIHDHRRGTVVGQRSYGKGSVQGIFPLALGGVGVRLTTAKFFSPSGRAISGTGVSPNVTVHLAAKPTADGQQVADNEDAMLKAAVQAARDQLAQR